MGALGGWFARVVGSEEEFALEHRLFNAACALTLVACVLYAPINLLFDTPAASSAPPLVLAALMGVFYYFGRVRRVFEPLVLPGFGVALGVFVALWFFDGGVEGGGQYFLCLGVLAALAVARGWRRVVVTVLMLVVGVAMFVVQYLHPEWIENPYHSRGVQFADLCTSFVVAIAVVGALVVALAQSYRITLARLDVERRKSETLLENVLPHSVSERLKRAPGVIADAFAGVTVLFADLVGFTELASTMPPAQVVALLNELFSQFDQLLERHGLEKIKTIGDAYMAVSGLPEPRADHAERAAAMALDLLAAVRSSPALPRGLELRIGLHSGPVVAGVIGTKKLTYDLWGDTVNIASRMESHAEPGQIQVTQATFALLRGGRFHLRKRGRISVKGRGELETYLLVGDETAARAS